MSERLIFLIGLSGSGKSTWAEEFVKEHDAELLSSDRLRLELFGDENDQRHNSEVFNKLHRPAIDFLKKGKTVVYDATGLSGSRRKSFSLFLSVLKETLREIGASARINDRENLQK